MSAHLFYTDIPAKKQWHFPSSKCFVSYGGGRGIQKLKINITYFSIFLNTHHCILQCRRNNHAVTDKKKIRTKFEGWLIFEKASIFSRYLRLHPFVFPLIVVLKLKMSVKGWRKSNDRGKTKFSEETCLALKFFDIIS